MDEEEVKEISLRIFEMLKELLPQEDLFDRCVECGEKLVLDPNTGKYYCSKCGLEQELALFSPQPQFPSKRFLGPLKFWRSRRDRVKTRISLEMVKICVEAGIQQDIAGNIFKHVKKHMERFHDMDIIRGRGRKNEDVVFALTWLYLNKEHSQLLERIYGTIGGFRLYDGVFKKITPLLQEWLDVESIIEKLERKCPERIEKVIRDVSYLYRKRGKKYYIPKKIDPSLNHVNDPMLYRLFELDPFRGDIVDDNEGYRHYDRRRLVPAAVTYTWGVKVKSKRLFLSFLKSLPPEERKKKRKGLVCVCTYIAAYLKAYRNLKFFRKLKGGLTGRDLKMTPFPKPPER